MEPRPYAFHKMEALVKQMQDPESGVPVGSQKSFLTSVPSAFIGYDLIEWLMEHLNIDDAVEAVHLANQLCQYGYYFPVDCKTLTIKDDNSLYRFQAAYHWPWHHRHPDNVEYAIYLVKRTLRNKQRHALEDYELEALNNLKRNLQNKWDLVTMQAEEQIKVGKERRKMDKQVADSQERAYWRVHRPPPGCQPPLEPSPITNLRRSTSPSPQNTELEILRRQVARSRIKVSQAVESLITYSSTYAEYDPFFTPPQPSNPWLSDDPAFWQFNLPLIEVPTEKRVKRWALSFEDLLADPTGVEEFTSYLRKEYSHENIRFWLAVKELRHCGQSQVPSKVNSIHQEFLAHGAPCEINIDSRTQEATLNEMKTPSRFTFDAAAHHVYTVLLNKDCYPRFIRSDQYKNLLANAKHPPTKKRFFGFGGVGKKKSCAGPVAASSVNKRRGSDRSLTGIVHDAPAFAPQTHVPLSTSQSNLHDITITRDSGVSPERINLLQKDLKQKSVERKQSSEDEKYVSECMAKSEPGPSLIHLEKCSSEVRDEGKTQDEKEKDLNAERKHSLENVVSKISDCGIQDDDFPTENIVTIITDEIVEPEETGNEKDAKGLLTTPTASVILPHAPQSTLTENIASSSESEAQEQSSTILDEDLEAQPLEQELESKTVPVGTPKSRRTAKKTRIMSEEGTRTTQVQKLLLSDENKQISIDLSQHSVRDECSEPCEPSIQVPADEVVPDDVHSSDMQNRADICPWEDEENCKTEGPFVKKYATLGYL
ncbi:regulator of G-protein signaling 7-like isoform X2 [Cimex lectularius]|uniref:Regulator of G-protein signaling 7 n=1 Tax=Cimex lectularius TaxID=79782 RepID=A0A8I6TF42_CIMLE|nr:regulator of G-protein signaling 7-like isoform X2 [Cimex lectularius]